METINWFAIIGVSLFTFALGALWYSPLMFGKTWMKIMRADKYSKEELAKTRKEMGKFYLLQFVMTFFTMLVLFFIMNGINPTLGLVVAFFMWLGFVMPTQVAGVIWGNTEKKFWSKQIGIMITYQLITLLIAGYVFSN